MSMQRRKFLTLLSSAATWPLAAHAQQGGRQRRIGVLMPFAESDPLAKARLSWFTQGLGELGWTNGRNVQLDVRWAGENIDQMQKFAKELVDMKPDVIVVTGAALTKAVQRQTRTIPIVFMQGGDALANGLVSSIARPEGNTTGFSNNFPTFGGKWLELLKDAVPRITRVALVFNPELNFGVYFPSIEAAAAQYAVTAIRTPVRNPTEIERAIEAFATEPNGGLIVLPPPFVIADRELINRLALRHRLPAIHSVPFLAVEGALMSYGPDDVDMFRRGGASYVDRILRGAKVSELPVQFPTKFQLVVNLKTAKAMGLTILETFLVRADDVIEETTP